MDSVANLTVDAGNFAPPSKTRADTLKIGMIVDFYQRMNYDAVALASRELGFGFNLWKDATQKGVPILAANVFSDKKAKKPLFKMKQANHRKDNGQFVIRKDHGHKLGVIGFVSQTAWKARSDTLSPFTFRSPFEMGDLVRKVAKKCDLLTVIGDFTMAEAESLSAVMPEIDMVVGSNIRVDQTIKHGKTAIVGLPPRGNNGNYFEFTPGAPDTARFTSKLVSLDTGAPEDSTIAKLLTKVKEQMTGPAPAPGKQVGQTAISKPVQATPQKPAPAPAPAPSKPVTPKPAPANNSQAAGTPAPATPATPTEPDGTNQ